jgi:cytochrome c oxidase cbb3-type subunit 4
MMAEMYHFLASLAQSLGVVYFMAVFGLVVLYALWPRNRAKFERAAAVPLEDE